VVKHRSRKSVFAAYSITSSAIERTSGVEVRPNAAHPEHDRSFRGVAGRALRPVEGWVAIEKAVRHQRHGVPNRR
jgi:hypothetical protein